MKSKIRSLILFTGLALSSISSLQANFIGEDFSPAQKKLEKIVRCRRITTGKISGQENVTAHYRKKLARLRTLSSSLGEKVATERNPIHQGTLIFLQGQAELLKENLYNRPALKAAELTRTETHEKESIRVQAKNYFADAKDAFEKTLKVKDSASFQEVYSSEDGPLLFSYALGIRKLADLTEDEDEKVGYLNNLVAVVSELDKKPNMTANHCHNFTALVHSERSNFEDIHRFQQFLIKHQDLVLEAIKFEKEWTIEPQVGATYANALTDHLNSFIKTK